MLNAPTPQHSFTCSSTPTHVPRMWKCHFSFFWEVFSVINSDIYLSMLASDDLKFTLQVLIWSFDKNSWIWFLKSFSQTLAQMASDINSKWCDKQHTACPQLTLKFELAGEVNHHEMGLKHINDLLRSSPRGHHVCWSTICNAPQADLPSWWGHVAVGIQLGPG